MVNVIRFFLYRLVIPLNSILLYVPISFKWLCDRYIHRLTLDRKTHWNTYYCSHVHMFSKLGRFPKLKKSEGLNDIVQWLKIFDQSLNHVPVSDKFAVREIVSNKVGEKYLVPLVGVYESVDQIPWCFFKGNIVVKANNDSGTVFLLKAPDEIDKKRDVIVRRLYKAFSQSYGKNNGEWVYSKIQPKVLVEKNICESVGESPDDYKFYCFQGDVKFCHYIYDRASGYPKEQIIDLEGRDLNIRLHPKFEYGEKFVVPDNWDEMIEVAKRLSEDFVFVRVDLFSVESGVYFGELTFWPMAGCYLGSGQNKLGELFDFDEVKYLMKD